MTDTIIQFKDGALTELNTINGGNVDWVLSNEPFTYFHLVKYDEYEKAEYKFMQSILKQKLEEFIEKHNLLELTANTGG